MDYRTERDGRRELRSEHGSRAALHPFSLGRIPALKYGSGVTGRIGEFVPNSEKRIALISGKSSYDNTPVREVLEGSLRESSLEWVRFPVSGEPSPETVDSIAEELRAGNFGTVIAIGGGSVLDTGKASSAMALHRGSVEDYLEGVGSKKPHGRRLPLIAIPTTAGTGSEATKNAVIGRSGEQGYKKSLRHEGFIPDIAVLDPTATVTSPGDLTAASGMDAVVQLLEAYVSTGANPFTDALALDGLRYAGSALSRVVENGEDIEARGAMAYAAYLSGIVLANAGLGVVHGLASPVGSAKSIPHGVVCAALIPTATDYIVEKLWSEQGSTGEKPLHKYAEAGRVLASSDVSYGDGAFDDTIGVAEKIEAENVSSTRDIPEETGDYKAARFLITTLYSWVNEFGIAPLSRYGVREEDIREMVKAGGAKKTPVQLDEEEMYGIVYRAL